MSKFIEHLPLWFYLAGSLCFMLGSIIALVRAG